MVEKENPPFPQRKHLVLISGLYVLLHLAWLLWARKPEMDRLVIGNLAMLFTSLLAAAAAVWVRRSLAADRALQRSWTWLAIGLAVWTLGDLLRTLLNAVQIAKDTQLVALEALYLLGSLPLWIGLAVYPRKQRQTFGRLELLFDMGLTTTAGLTLVWISVLQPMQTWLPAGSRPTALIYPLVDLAGLLLLLNLFLLAETGTLSAAFGWIFAGLAAYTVTDLVYATLLNTGAYQIGSPVDVGWVLGDMALFIGAIAQLGYLARANPTPRLQRVLTRFQYFLPLIATLTLGLYTVLEWQFVGVANLAGLWVTVVLSLGLIARQGILAGEVQMQRYANLVNSIAEPTFVCDERGGLRLANPALLTAAGYDSPQQLIGKPLTLIIESGKAGDTVPLLKSAMGGGWSGEARLLRRDGTTFPISLALRPLPPTGDSRLALAGTAHDLSLEKQRQDELRQANQQIAKDRAELERLNVGLEKKVAEKTANLTAANLQLEQQNLRLRELDRLKSDFVSMVSHELRSPLTNINGGIELSLASGGMPARTEENLSLVQDEILRLTRFVETILDLSALEAGRLPLYPAPVELQHVVQTMQRQLSRQADAARVVWQVPPNLPPMLADEQALTSVLFHLLDNAFKYAPQGHIWLSASQAPDGRIRVQVLDEGPGIPPEVIPMLFDQFYRSNPEDAQTVYGHGLGLYIVQRLLDAMGGMIQAENCPQGGARFVFWLPEADACTDEEGG
ncbi:MAG: ATP-binding protein [Anaerolineaceae bacterium]|jgi:PAS domain S-box-containing protein|nr:ATP-binding protein [Anaerolineaceae bacterium]